jgi:hypothetical protein
MQNNGNGSLKSFGQTRMRVDKFSLAFDRQLSLTLINFELVQILMRVDENFRHTSAVITSKLSSTLMQLLFSFSVTLTTSLRSKIFLFSEKFIMSEQNFIIFEKNYDISGNFLLFSEKIICPEKIMTCPNFLTLPTPLLVLTGA